MPWMPCTKPRVHASSLPTPPHYHLRNRDSAGDLTKVGLRAAANTTTVAWELGKGAVWLAGEAVTVPGKVRGEAADEAEIARERG